MQEADGPVEHAISVGGAALMLAELRVASKPGGKKPGRKKRPEAADGEERDDDAPAEDGTAAQREPVPSQALLKPNPGYLVLRC